MPDYSEVIEARAGSEQTPSGPTQQQISAFMRESGRGAVVLAELLESPAWNIFRATLSSDFLRAEAERTQLRVQLEVGALVGDERDRADLRLQYLRGRVEAFQIALDLPKALIKKHNDLETIVLGKDVGARIIPPVTSDEPPPVDTSPPEPIRGSTKTEKRRRRSRTLSSKRTRKKA